MLARARRTRFWAVGCLIVGVGAFVLQDVFIKLISGAYPIHQVMTIRSLVALPLLLAMVRSDGGLQSVFPPRSRILAVRGLIVFLSDTAFYLGLSAMPIATCVALFFTAPLFITLLSVLALKEKVGLSRWAAVLIGFAGVLIIVRPGSGLFEWAALLPVTAGIAYAGSQIIARQVGETEGPATIAAYTNIVFLAGASAMATVLGGGGFADERHASLAFLLRGWATPSWTDLLLMMLCGVLAAAALTLTSEAYRSSPANKVAPFEYSALGWSMFYGWVVWSEWPDMPGWIGMAVILAAGLYVLYGEPTQSSAGSSRPLRRSTR